MTSVEHELDRMIHRTLRASGGAPQGLQENLEAFFSAVDFREPLLQTVIVAHLTFAAMAVITRKNTSMQIGMLGVALLIVLSASYINEFGRQHWKQFATQNYFDSTGVFVSLFLSGPLLIVSFGILLHSLYRASRLLVVVKAKQLQQQRQQKTRQTAAAGEVHTQSNEQSSEPQRQAMRAGDVDGDQPLASPTPSPSPASSRHERPAPTRSSPRLRKTAAQRGKETAAS